MGYDLSPQVLVEKDGPVRLVMMNRPEVRNAVDEGMHRGLALVWRQLAEDDDARAVILSGAGGAFSAGGDRDVLTRMQQDLRFRRAIMREARQIVREMAACRLPMVAAIHGPAVGLGCSIAMLCDIVLMADDAYLRDPHVAVGLVAGDGGVVTWPLMTSLLKAKEYLFTGDRIPAREAERIGLANRVVPADRLLPEATALAHRLATAPAAALEHTKRALNIHLERAISGVLDYALAAEEAVFPMPSGATGK